ncbi:MAG: hypothetical protein BGO63_02115 [Candidatus Accumulibacter sp. 66-26]|nr:MAG: hypothetical protein BGO63_02115 [Candidatus Accumulibacter sp. 66-26]
MLVMMLPLTVSTEVLPMVALVIMAGPVPTVIPVMVVVLLLLFVALPLTVNSVVTLPELLSEGISVG